MHSGPAVAIETAKCMIQLGVSHKPEPQMGLQPLSFLHCILFFSCLILYYTEQLHTTLLKNGMATQEKKVCF